jgi:hypothetical protein
VKSYELKSELLIKYYFKIDFSENKAMILVQATENF